MERNFLNGPLFANWDAGIIKNIPLDFVKEGMRFQIRGEAFNALNKVNLGTPNRFVNTPQFGTITMAMTPGREIQVSARLSF